MLKESTYQTPCGTIHYWSSILSLDTMTLVFLPGLTADHRLFDKQVEHFEEKYNIIVWDAPAHASSWPFRFEFDLFDKAKWLNEILEKEEIIKPIIIGQSMGGYVGQAYAQLYPERLAGFISIDSAPLQRNYVTAVEIWLLKRMEPIYAHYPWKLLLKSGTEGVATSNYGRNLMREMMLVYDGNQHRYAQIAGHGFRILAAAMEKDLPDEIKCPSLLICGTKDHAGSCIRYNRAWHQKTKIPFKYFMTGNLKLFELNNRNWLSCGKNLPEILLGYYQHHGGNNEYSYHKLFRRMDKIYHSDKPYCTATSGACGLYRNPMLCERLSGRTRILLKENGQLKCKAVLFY